MPIVNDGANWCKIVILENFPQNLVTEEEENGIEDTIVTEGLSLLNVLHEESSNNIVCSSIQCFIDTSLHNLQKECR